MNERRIEPELLDDLPLDRKQHSLRDLERINRLLGGYRVYRDLLRRAVGGCRQFSVLDVGAASGDLARVVRRAYPEARVCSLDHRLEHFTADAAPKVAGDAFRLPFRDRSFDFVFSSLFLHHFTDLQIVVLFEQFQRVAKRGVLAMDLERGEFARRFLPATEWLFHWDPITLHDGPISVDAAFKKDELLQLARRAGLERAEVRRHRPWARLSLVAMLG